MNPYIFGIDIICEMFLVHEYDHTHYCLYVRLKKKAKNGILTRQTLGGTDLIYGMHTQLDI